MMHGLKLFRILFLAFALVATTPAAAKQAPISPEEAFQLEITRLPGGDVAFLWRVAEDHYLYRDHTVATTAGGVDSLLLSLDPGISKADPGFGVVDVWYGSGRAMLSAGTLEAAGSPAEINITYQGCFEDAICYPPMTRTVSLPSAVASDSTSPDLTVREADIETASAASAVALEASVAAVTSPPGPAAAEANISVQSGGGMVEGLLTDGGVVWVLLGFFGFGVLLAFTPCVFPMYPILAGVIGGGGQKVDGRRGFTLSAAYVLGLATAFALLGAVAAWSGQNLQMALQSAWAVGLLSLIFVALALSMFGLYEIQLPAAWTSRISGSGQGRGQRSLTSAGGMGFASALVVGPCVTAPLAGALIYIAQTGDVALGAAALFFLGLGKGAPLIVFGTVGARFLPRAGQWMNHVKAAFGVLFLLTAWWLSDRVLPPDVSLLIGAALMLLIAVLTGLFRRAPEGGVWAGASRAAGLAAAVWGVLLIVGAATGAQDPWRPLNGLSARSGAPDAVPEAMPATVVTDTDGLSRAVASAANAGTPSVIEFTADWCVSCRVIERTVFGDPEVQAGLADVHLVHVDVTRTNAETRRLMEDLAVVGPPSMIFLDGEASEPEGTRLIGEMSARDVLTSIARAGDAT
jgi:thioredoxin:protein disulfide reductase